LAGYCHSSLRDFDGNCAIFIPGFHPVLYSVVLSGPGTRNLEPWNYWNPGTIGTLEQLEPGTIGTWNYWNLELLEHGTIGTLEPGTWNLESTISATFEK
jgi:hypothetical protein